MSLWDPLISDRSLRCIHGFDWNTCFANWTARLEYVCLGLTGDGSASWSGPRLLLKSQKVAHLSEKAPNDHIRLNSFMSNLPPACQTRYDQNMNLIRALVRVISRKCPVNFKPSSFVSLSYNISLPGKRLYFQAVHSAIRQFHAATKAAVPAERHILLQCGPEAAHVP